MTERRPPTGRRELGKEEKRRRITTAAQQLFARHGVGGVTTQQIADRADVAIGTLFLDASSKAELLIMVQNNKFAAAVDEGLAAADCLGTADSLGRVLDESRSDESHDRNDEQSDFS